MGKILHSVLCQHIKFKELNKAQMWSEGYNRYQTEIAKIFSLENKTALQLSVELALAEVQEQLQMIPKGTVAALKQAIPQVKTERILEIEKETHHDLMAMVKAFAEQAGDAGEYIHNTATSMDIQDTVLALQMMQAREQIIMKGKEIMDILTNHAKTYRDVPQLARTHGQFAVPTTVGFKLANFLYEFIIAFQRLQACKIQSAKFSGAVGNYASSMRLDIEKLVLEKLGLEPVKISTQVVTRQIHAEFIISLAIIASIVERMAKEIRHLQRSEINEWLEPRKSTQVGSSAMPHKRNPHKTERLNGLARVLRANVQVSLENIALEHERDLTNSSNERLIIPENVILLDFMLSQLSDILKDLVINTESIQKNLSKASVSKSEQILKLLIPKIGRQAGHELLRVHVEADDFKTAVLNDEKVLQHIDRETLNGIFNDISLGLGPQKVDEVLDYYSSINFS